MRIFDFAVWSVFTKLVHVFDVQAVRNFEIVVSRKVVCKLKNTSSIFHENHIC